MPQIPQYEQQTRLQGSGLGPGPQDDASGLLIRAGQEIGQDLASIERFQQREQEQTALVSANEELQQARAHWASEMNARQQNAPEGGAGFSESILADFDKDMTERVSRVRTEGAREALRSQLASVRLAMQNEAQDFEIGAGTRERARKLESGTDAARIAVEFRPDDYEDILAAQLTAIGGSGLTPEQKAIAMHAAGEAIAGAAVSGMIRKDPRSTLTELNNEKTASEAILALSPEQRAHARSAAQSEINRLEAEARAARAEAQDSLRGDIADAFAARAFGMPATLPTRARYVAAYGPDGAERYAGDTKRWAVFDVVGEAAFQPPAEAVATIGKLKPASQEGAAEGVANYQAAMQLYTRQREALEANPVETLVRSDPQIQAAAQAAAQDPEQIPAYLEALRAKQKVLQIPEPKLLSESQRQQIAGSLVWDAKAPRRRVETMAALQATYGDAFPEVLREIAPKLEGHARVLANMTPHEAVRLDAAYAQKDAYKDVLPAGATNDIKSALDVHLAEFNTTLADNPDGVERAAEHHAAAVLYAQELVRNGTAPEDAAEQAANAVANSQYIYRDTLRIPAVLDGDQIVRAADEKRAQVANEGKFLVETMKHSTPEQAQEDMQNLIRRSGYWVTNEHGDGIVLRIPHRQGLGEVYRADGSRVEFKFQDLAAVELEAGIAEFPAAWRK